MENVVHMEMALLIDTVLDGIASGAEVTMRGCGTSMYPFIDETTDQIVLARPDSVPLRVGQIYLYRRATGCYSIHRLYRLEGDTAAMLGDNQYFIEGGIPHTDLLAVVTAVIKPEGRVDCISDDIVRLQACRMRRRINCWRLRCLVRRILSLPRGVLRRLCKLFRKKT